MGWLILAVVIAAGVASVLGQVMKAQREAAPTKRRRGGQPESGKGGEFDKFLAEIERLRQKPAATPVSTAPPVVAPVAKKVAKRSKKRIEETAPVAVPVAAPVRQKMAAADPVPVVTVQSRGTTQAPKTDNGKLLLALLSSPQSVPAAFVLTEILGPPRSKQPWGRSANERLHGNG